MANQSGPSSDTLTIEIETMAWERIQLVLRARVPAGLARIDPGRLGLQADDAAGTFLPATHAEIDGNRLYLRFNVMQGPGLMPLETGTWRVVASRVASDVTNESRVRVVPVGTTPGQVTRDFAVGRLVLQFAAEANASGVTLRVSRRRSTDAGRVANPVAAARSAMRRARVRIRRRIFGLLIDLFRRVRSTRRKRVVFISASRSRLEGNLAAIHERLIERSLGSRLDIKIVTKPDVTARYDLLESIRLAWLLGTADVILLDQLQRAMNAIRFPPDIRIIQTWHASGAFKTVGYSRIGKSGAADPFSWAYKSATHALVSSAHDAPFYAEAFGIPEDRMVPTGIPRMDRFFDERLRAQAIEAACEAFPQTVGRRVILFAPTFRGPTASTAYYDVQLLDFAKLHRLAVEKDAVVLMKMHPHVRNRGRLTIPGEYHDRLVDATDTKIDVNDLLMITDLLVTDYSSIVFEFSTLGRPMLFFAYDLDEYIASRDFYVPFREFVPGRIVTTFDELLEAIRNEDFQVEKVAEFARRHFDHLDGTSTDRVIDELILP